METKCDYHKRVPRFENTRHIYSFGKLTKHEPKLKRIQVSEANMKKKEKVKDKK